MSKTAGLFDLSHADNTIKAQKDPEGVIVTVSGGAHNTGKYSKSDIDKLLQGYIILPKQMWTSMERGTHVRYMRNDGRFVRGGFVNSYVSQNGRDMLTLANGFNASEKGYSIWTVALDGVREIYIKKDKIPTKKASTLTAAKTDEIAALKKSIVDMQKRLKKIEDKKIIKK